MPRKATGSYYKSGDLWYASVTLGAGSKGRKSIPLPVAKSEEQAAAHTAIVNDLAQKLRAAELVGDALRLLIEAGSREGKALDRVVRAVDALCKGELAPKRAALMDATFEQVAQMWTSGELARDYKDYVKPKRTWHAELTYLRLHINPFIGQVRIRDFENERGLELGESVMAALPTKMAVATRCLVAKTIVRVLNLAVYPLKILKHSPLPKGFVPKLGPEKAKGCVYPDEDAQLLGCGDVWIGWRLYSGFKHREGMRDGEAKACTWLDFDLVRGSVTLDKNKTDNPRAWALQPGVVRTLAAWRLYRESLEGPLRDDGLVFVNPKGRRIGVSGASRYRDHLIRAGIKRESLFQHNESRQRIRSHDTRATFITIALANGRTETWVQDRTGHKDSRMINTYRRTARTFAELSLGDLRPMDELIPELAPFLALLPTDGSAPRSEAPAQTAAERVEDHPSAPETGPATVESTGPDTAPGVLVAVPVHEWARHDAGGGIVAGIVAGQPWGGLELPRAAGGFINGFKGFTVRKSLPTIPLGDWTAS